MNYNRTCNLEDFADLELRDTIRDVFADELAAFPPEYPDGVADSRQWEIAMAVRALRDHGCLTRQSRILGVGAGTEVTCFYLTRHVAQVFATDLYGNAGEWVDVAPAAFLVSPGLFSPIPYEEKRLVPLHMDGRVMALPDNSFDGVFSLSSIEHFGTLEFVANAAYEIGRVLRPGGIASISTEFKVAGPPAGDGWKPTMLLLSKEKLSRYIIEASGLTPVDALDVEISDATLSTRRDLSQFPEYREHVTACQEIASYPKLILYHEGYLFCSVHLALRKTESYPAADNTWAAPSEATRELVRRSNSGESTQPGSSLLELLSASCGDQNLEISRLQRRLDQAERGYADIKASMSWRVTAPLRAALGLIQKLGGK